MPAKLQVPEAYVPYLAELARLSPGSLKSLLRGLRDEKLTLGLDDFAESIAKRLSIDHTAARGIAELLSSLYLVREGLGGDTSELILALRSAIEATEKVELLPADWPAFEDALAEIFSEDSALSLSAKALDVLTDHQRVFLHARVLTDLRPVFKSNIAEAPVAMIPVHSLKLVYRSEGVPRDFYVALDSQDVKSLLDVLQRAVSKEESLRGLVEEKGLTILEVKS